MEISKGTKRFKIKVLKVSSYFVKKTSKAKICNQKTAPLCDNFAHLSTDYNSHSLSSNTVPLALKAYTTVFSSLPHIFALLFKYRTHFAFAVKLCEGVQSTRNYKVHLERSHIECLNNFLFNNLGSSKHSGRVREEVNYLLWPTQVPSSLLFCFFFFVILFFLFFEIGTV